MENDINFNYSECVKQYEKFGDTVYQNICNGKTNTVPWGIGGYTVAVFCILCAIVLISVITMFIRELFELFD